MRNAVCSAASAVEPAAREPFLTRTETGRASPEKQVEKAGHPERKMQCLFHVCMELYKGRAENSGSILPGGHQSICRASGSGKMCGLRNL